MGPVFSLTVRQLTGKWRIAIMTVLGLLPVGFTALVVRAERTPFIVEFESIVFSGMLFGSIAPLIVVAIASVAFSNEVEDRTLANLTLTPIPRWQIVFPKMAAAVAVCAPFVLGSAFLTSWIAYNQDPLAVLALTSAALAGLVMYASMFVWLGLVTPQAIGVGLLYIVLWEGFFSGFVSGVRFASVRFYSIALANGLDPRRFVADEHVGLLPTAAVVVAVLMVFFGLAIRRLRTMDVP